MRDRVMGGFASVIPFPVQQRLKGWGVYRLLHLFYDKYDAELLFQREWAQEFKRNQSKAREDWREYRDLDQLVSDCKITERTRVLDVGCGISTVLHFLPGERFGIDPLAEEYKKLYDYPKPLTIQKGSGEQIPFPRREF